MLLKQSTARNLMVFMADSSDHITGKTGLTLTITASKDGAAFASISPTVTDRGSGWYNLALTTSHTDTLGDLAIHITGTGADATDISRQVVLQIPGDVLTANTVQVNGTSQTARDLGASVLLSPGTGTGQISLSSGQVTASSVSGNVSGSVLGSVNGVTGNVTGSVGSVVGNISGNVNGNVTGSVGSVVGVVTANMTQIDGSATNGNNATLKLKSLDIQSDSYLVNAINIVGGYNASGRGGPGVRVVGGDGTSHGYGVHISPSASGSGSGPAVFLDGSVGGCYGLQVTGKSVPPILLQRLDSGSIVIDTVGNGSVIGIIHANMDGAIGSLDTQAKADVNAEVKDVLETDTQAEPTSPPASTASLRDKIAWVFTLWKNKRIQTTTTETVLADDGTTPIATSAKSDTGTTFTRGKFQ